MASCVYRLQLGNKVYCLALFVLSVMLCMHVNTACSTVVCIQSADLSKLIGFMISLMPHVDLFSTDSALQPVPSLRYFTINRSAVSLPAINNKPIDSLHLFGEAHKELLLFMPKLLWLVVGMIKPYVYINRGVYH